MRYEFIAGEDCPVEFQQDEEGRRLVYEIDMPMSEAPSIGSAIPNPMGEGHLVRICSLPHVVTREVLIPWDSKNPVMRTNVNGQEIKMKFVDHPHTDPSYTRALNQMGAKDGISSVAASSAYRSEKHGRPVVDVVSNVPDPLGKIKRAATHTTQRAINTPVRRRK